MKPLPNVLTHWVPTFAPVTRRTMFGMEASASVKYCIYSLAHDGWFSLRHKHEHKPTYAGAMRC